MSAGSASDVEWLSADGRRPGWFTDCLAVGQTGPQRSLSQVTKMSLRDGCVLLEESSEISRSVRRDPKTAGRRMSANVGRHFQKQRHHFSPHTCHRKPADFLKFKNGLRCGGDHNMKIIRFPSPVCAHMRRRIVSSNLLKDPYVKFESNKINPLFKRQG